MKKIYYLLLTAVLFIQSGMNAFADEEHPWAGTFTLMCSDDAPYIYLGDETDPYSCAKYGYQPTDTFQVTISWNEATNSYLVTNFYGYDTKDLEAGGFELSVIDEKNAQIILPEIRNLTYYIFDTIPADTTYTENEDGTIDTTYVAEVNVGLRLYGGGSSFPDFTPIDVYLNSDGQISLGGFKVIWVSPSGGTIPSIWFDGATPLNGGDEPEEVVVHDWAGTYMMTLDYFYKMDEESAFEVPNEGILEIGDDGFGNYVVTKFLDFDTAAANAFTGGIYITPNKKNGNKATIDVSQYMNFLQTTDDFGMAGYALLDAYSTNDYGIDLEYNESDNSITIGTFYIVNTAEDNAIVGLAFGATAVPYDETSIKNVENTTTSVDSNIMYNVAGQRIQTPSKGHIYIKGSKKYLAK